MGIRDLFRPGWKHSDPSVRANAIHFLEEHQQDILHTIALEDEEVSKQLEKIYKKAGIKVMTGSSVEAGTTCCAAAAAPTWCSAVTATTR